MTWRWKHTGRIKRLRAAVLALSVAAVWASAACAMRTPPREWLALTCRVDGAKLLRPAATAQAACARLQALLGRGLGIPVRPLANRGAGGDGLHVDLAFRASGIATARATRSRAGLVTSYPEVGIARSDRPLGLDVVDGLARDLVAQIARADALREN